MVSISILEVHTRSQAFVFSLLIFLERKRDNCTSSTMYSGFDGCGPAVFWADEGRQISRQILSLVYLTRLR